MFSGFLFTITRIFEIIILIPIWGMLAWFVDRYQPNTPPDRILYLFIVTIIATVYCLFTLVLYRRMLWTPILVAFLDLVFFGVLIGGLVLLAPSVRNTDCVSWNGEGVWWLGFDAGEVKAEKQCMMLKSSWGLAIAVTILFFLTSVLAWHIWHRGGVVYEERPTVRRRRRAYW